MILFIFVMGFRYTLAFLLGFISCIFLFFMFSYSGLEVPFATGLVAEGLGIGGLGFGGAVAPSDWVDKDDIIVFDDMVVLRIANATLSNYASGGSMKPILDKSANGIRVVPKNSDEIDVGDIVSFRYTENLIVHRVVENGIDDEGVYFITQGDNNFFADEKIRFEDIEFVTVGIIF
jgi:hypothetical protein